MYMFKQLDDFRCGLKERATVNSLHFIESRRQFCRYSAQNLGEIEGGQALSGASVPPL